MERLPAAIIEHGRALGHVGANILCDRAIVHVAMVLIDVERMFGIPEGDPVAHELSPGSPYLAQRMFRRSGHRFAVKNMRHSTTARACPDSEGTGHALATIGQALPPARSFPLGLAHQLGEAREEVVAVARAG